jgi:predicted transposase YdaD
MPQYTFKINELEYRTVDALDLDDALEHAGIAKDDPYELIWGDDFDDKYLISAITDEIL